MKKQISLLIIFLFSSSVFAEDKIKTLTGDTKLSCEAILCLASPTTPSECIPSIRKLFSFWKIGQRRDFLNLCPVAISNNEHRKIYEEMGIDWRKEEKIMDKYKDILSNMSHECTANSLNSTHQRTGNKTMGYSYRAVPYLSNACVNYYNHEWVQREKPVYRGNGKWYSSPSEATRNGGWEE